MKTKEKRCTPAIDMIALLRNTQRLLTPSEAANVLNKHVETIYRDLRKRRIPAVLDGWRWKIDPRKLADWLEERSTDTGLSKVPAPRTPAPREIVGGLRSHSQTSTTGIQTKDFAR